MVSPSRATNPRMSGVAERRRPVQVARLRLVPHLIEDAVIVEARVVLEQSPLIVQTEDVDEVVYDPAPIWRDGAGRSLSELTHEESLDAGLAGDQVSLDDHDAPVDRQVVEGITNGGEVCHEAVEVSLKSPRPVEPERWREIRREFIG